MGDGGRGLAGRAHVRPFDAARYQGRIAEPLRPSRARARSVGLPAQQGNAAGDGEQPARLPAAHGDDRAGGALVPWRHQVSRQAQARGGVMSTTAKISWVDGALFVAEAGSGHTITMDGAPDVGGRNLASRPLEGLAMGMGG